MSKPSDSNLSNTADWKDPSGDGSLADDPRVLSASREYLAALETGRKPSRSAWIKRNPDLTEVLTECFDGIDLAHSLKPPAPPLAALAAEFPASPLGDFQITREIDRGGMGIVYEAIQLSLGRRVALKVLPFASALDTKHLQRFKTEAHAAAQLHHTNIVPVHAVGCERGVHFYAMQLIDGRSMAGVIDERRLERSGLTDDSTVKNQAGVTLVSNTIVRESKREQYLSAARMAASIADALDYAHEVGVVHRDIKPANILLDAKGGVWITDFGLAQIAADTGLTQSGDLIGTLRYSSPEQASGQRVLLDHRTDIYSLGATLYEWLTLEPIFTAQDRRSLLHQILETEPRLPRLIDRSIPEELETIILKCLSKAPVDRYASAGALAADLRRFIDDRPIQARRPSLLDRGRKWLRRHPLAVAVAVGCLILGCVGLAGATAIVMHQKSLTQEAYQREARRAKEAEDRFELARRAADDLIDLAENELINIPFQEGLRKQLLEAAADYYQELIELRGEDPDAQAELAATRDHVQKILSDLALLKADRQLFLLRESMVLDDLGVEESQRQRAADFVERLSSPESQAIRHLPRGPEKSRRQLELARQHEAELAGLLTDDQLHRLRQIALQCQGSFAFKDPDVVRDLKLTNEQREKMREFEYEAFSSRSDRDRDRGSPRPPGPPPGPPPFESSPSSGGEQAELRINRLVEKIVALLTPEQIEVWSNLIGEPYLGPKIVPGRDSYRPRN